MDKVYCGKVNKSHLNTIITVYGWVKKNRKLGSLIFLDLGDRYGLVQVVANQESPLFDTLLKISKESVLKITGKVVLRSAPNEQIKTGLYEIIANEIEIISRAENTPFVIDEECDALEDTRLKYRYLDLRRNVVRDRIIFRSKVIQSFRNTLIQSDFIEVETPMLCGPTPEGAKEYYVPTRNKPGYFYALPQSPQTFKQLLMVSGFDKYFQVARCLRDEPLRSDRQPEFTQLDMEWSFVDEVDIQTTIEHLMQKMFHEVLNQDLKIPFDRMDYDVAMNNYGCDKPDLRFSCKIQDGCKYFKNTSFKVFKRLLDEHKSIKFICLPDFSVDKKQVLQLEKFAKDNDAKGLAWLTIENGEIKSGSIANVIERESIVKIITDNNTKTCSLFFVADEEAIALQALGAVRNEIGRMFNLTKPEDFKFVWIINWPLYEYNKETKQFVAAHHPFTSPSIDCLSNFDKDKACARARSYDIVLNGYEVGGGSIRINDADVQNRLFKSIGMNEQQITKKFGFLLKAFKYGVPIHGGIALGLDRLIMLLTHTNNIKDVICFPKNSTGNDLMLESPSILEEDELLDLNLRFKE